MRRSRSRAARVLARASTCSTHRPRVSALTRVSTSCVTAHLATSSRTTRSRRHPLRTSSFRAPLSSTRHALRPSRRAPTGTATPPSYTRLPRDPAPVLVSSCNRLASAQTARTTQRVSTSPATGSLRRVSALPTRSSTRLAPTGSLRASRRRPRVATTVYTWRSSARPTPCRSPPTLTRRSWRWSCARTLVDAVLTSRQRTRRPSTCRSRARSTLQSPRVVPGSTPRSTPAR